MGEVSKAAKNGILSAPVPELGPGRHVQGRPVTGVNQGALLQVPPVTQVEDQEATLPARATRTAAALHPAVPAAATALSGTRGPSMAVALQVVLQVASRAVQVPVVRVAELRVPSADGVSAVAVSPAVVDREEQGATGLRLVEQVRVVAAEVVAPMATQATPGPLEVVVTPRRGKAVVPDLARHALRLRVGARCLLAIGSATPGVELAALPDDVGEDG